MISDYIIWIITFLECEQTRELTHDFLDYVIIKFGFNAHCHWLKERAL